MKAFSDYEDKDGRIDWTAYHKAQEDDGERCITCGALIIFANGTRAECRSCKRVNDDDGEIDHDSIIRCPKCRETFTVADTDMWELYSEDDHDVSCPECDHEFNVVTSVSYSFCSPEIELPHDK